jgi:hypothetical protein
MNRDLHAVLGELQREPPLDSPQTAVINAYFPSDGIALD